MLNSRNQNISYEKQTKFIQDRITSVEKNFAEICSSFGAYARKVARVRDTGDELAKVVQAYANGETVNKSLSTALANLATTFSAIEDYRNAYVQRLEFKVITELSQYDGICRHARGEVKHTLSVRDSEVARKRVLDRVKERNPLSKQQIMHAEAELLKASADMSRTSKELDEQTDLFEKHKLEDIKMILQNFIEMGMVFHSKALELLTVAHRQVKNIDEKSDLQEFRSQLSSQTDHKSIHKQSGHGSLASLLGQREKVQSKSLNSVDSLRTLSENSDDEDDAESSNEKISPKMHKRSNSFY